MIADGFVNFKIEKEREAFSHNHGYFPFFSSYDLGISMFFFSLSCFELIILSIKSIYVYIYIQTNEFILIFRIKHSINGLEKI